jgi:hypothetical protein
MGQAELRKSIGFIVATSLAIGSGIFMKPGVVIAAAGDSTMALWAWIISGIMTLAGGLTIAELSVKNSENRRAVCICGRGMRKVLGLFMRMGANDHLWSSSDRSAWTILWFVICRGVRFFKTDGNMNRNFSCSFSCAH